MKFAFTKMNGAGNDFVLVDNRQNNVQLSPEQVVLLCHRQRGIGADGLLLLKRCTSGKADWAWEFFNSDGSSAQMCGNGARCFARFIQRVTGVAGKTSFETGAGIIHAQFNGEQVTVTMTDPKGLKLFENVFAAGANRTLHSLDTGVPHAVLFVDDVETVAVNELGAAIRSHPHFAPHGTNVNFVQLRDNEPMRVRTFERGVEGETLACGTGVTASALITSRLSQLPSPISVEVQGGDVLQVGFQWSGLAFKEVTLTGPAQFVFDGVIALEP